MGDDASSGVPHSIWPHIYLQLLQHRALHSVALHLILVDGLIETHGCAMQSMQLLLSRQVT